MTTFAIVMLVLTGVIVLASVWRGIMRYRAVMRREWPKVPPRDDEDDW